MDDISTFVARAVVDEAVDALAHVVIGAVLLADPELVVLAGGVAEAGTALTDPVTKALQQALPWRTIPPVVLSMLGADAGARGAALLAWEAVDATRHRAPAQASHDLPEPHRPAATGGPTRTAAPPDRAGGRMITRRLGVPRALVDGTFVAGEVAMDDDRYHRDRSAAGAGRPDRCP